MTQRTAKELTIGDKVLSSKGKVLRVKAIGKGFWPGSVLIDWNDGNWSCLPGTDLLILTEAHA